MKISILGVYEMSKSILTIIITFNYLLYSSNNNYQYKMVFQDIAREIRAQYY